MKVQDIRDAREGDTFKVTHTYTIRSDGMVMGLNGFGYYVGEKCNAGNGLYGHDVFDYVKAAPPDEIVERRFRVLRDDERCKDGDLFEWDDGDISGASERVTDACDSVAFAKAQHRRVRKVLRAVKS